jgi:Ca2+-binding EF-hand superfamily protein
MWSHISVADANADGAVTQEELRAAHDQGKIQRPEGRGNGERMFARFDANQDGKLVASEVPAEAWSRISVADANADGAVTQEELRAAHDQGKIQRRAGRGKGPRS